MLILTRSGGESVVIGNGITVTVLKVDGRVVRLGIGAPETIAIRRKEGIVDTAETTEVINKEKQGHQCAQVPSARKSR
jgi:carbon storage regulator CsrA